MSYDYDGMQNLADRTREACEDVSRVAKGIWMGIFPHNGRTFEKFVELKRSYNQVAPEDFAPEEMRLQEVVRISEVEVGDLLLIVEASGQEKRQYGRINRGLRPWMTAREQVEQMSGCNLYLVVGKTAKRLKVVVLRKPGAGWDVDLADLKHSSPHLNMPETIDPAAVTRLVIRVGVYTEVLARLAEHPDFGFWEQSLARAKDFDEEYNTRRAVERDKANREFAPKKAAGEKLNQLAGEEVVRVNSYISNDVRIADWLKTEARLRTYLLGCMVEREWNEYDIDACASALTVLGWNK